MTAPRFTLGLDASTQSLSCCVLDLHANTIAYRDSIGYGQHLGDRADPVPVRMGAKAIVEGRSAEPVAVGNLDRVDFGAVESLRNRLHMVEAILVTNRVHPVAQRHVLDIEFGLRRIEGHAGAPTCRVAAMRSAVRRAADVMISRFPA